MSFSAETGGMASRMAAAALVGLAIGGGLGLLVGVLVGSGGPETVIFVGIGIFVGALIGGALGWFRGLGQVSPREGPYDE